MSTIGIIVFHVLVAAIAIWAIYRNVSDAHRSKDLSAQVVSIKDENSLQVRALEPEVKVINRAATKRESDFDQTRIEWNKGAAERERYWIGKLKEKEREMDSLKRNPIAGIGPESEAEDITRDDPRMMLEVHASTGKGAIANNQH